MPWSPGSRWHRASLWAGTVSSSPPSETILTLISRAKEVGTGMRPKSGSWSVAESSLPAVQPGSRAFFPERCHLLLPGRGCRQDEGRVWSQGPSGDRVLFFVFLLGPRGVWVSALGAGSEADISRVPSGAPSRDLGGEGSRTGPKVGGAELRAGSTKPSHGGEGDTPGALGTPALREIFLLSAGEPQAPAPA